MNLEPKLQELEAIYVELEKRMADPEVVSNVKEMQELSKKHSELDEVVTDYRRYKQVRAEIAEAKELAGGGDPAQWLEKLSGRVPVIHLKDYAYGRQMAVVGEGNINFGRVFEKAEAAGTQFMLVEQDDCHGEDPFECLRRSYEYLRSWGFR